ncbi:MAG: hypothetical protein IPL39_19950 [Opitutaceae bacterium]|nr:hypothetical protein [Opitutaceae bacterium]
MLSVSRLVISASSPAFLALVVVLHATPSITQQPHAVVAVSGDAVFFNVAATGTGQVGYQWRKFGFPLQGETGSTLNLPSAKQTDTGFYDVVVTDAESAVVSVPAQLTVQALVTDTYRLDPSFMPLFEADGATVSSVGVAEGGIVYVGGTFSTIAGQRRQGLARFKPALTLDPGFTPILDGGVRALVVQPDGKVVIGGDFARVNGMKQGGISRLNPDGSIDESFASGSGFSDIVERLLLLNNGNVVVAGGGGYYDGQLCGGSSILSPDGRLVGSFGAGDVFAMACQADGKILVAGRYYLRRFAADGTPDPTFTVPDISGLVRAVAVQSDGKIIVGGSFSAYGSVPAKRIVRLLADGSVDSSFVVGSGFDDEVTSLRIFADGRIIAGGSFRSFAGVECAGVAMLSSTGSWEHGFVRAGSLPFSVAELTTTPANQIVVAGKGWSPNKSVAVLDERGTVQAVAASGLRSWLYVVRLGKAMAVSGGKWLISGEFTHVDGAERRSLVRLNADGTVDLSFDSGDELDIPATALLEQPDGKVLLGLDRGVGKTLIRLNVDGTRDTGFAVGADFATVPQALSLLPDGRIAVAGAVRTWFGGPTSVALAVLLPEGAADLTYRPSKGAAIGSVSALAVRGDGGLWVGGRFYWEQEGAYKHLALLGAHGELQGEFGLDGSAYDSGVRAIVDQEDGRVLIGGEFSGAPGGLYRQNLCRLNPDLSLDAGYDPGPVGGGPWCLVPLGGGGVLTNMPSQDPSDVSLRYISRLTSQGTRDRGFAAFDLWDKPATGVLVGDDRRILVIGPNGKRNGTKLPSYTMLKPDASPMPVIEALTGDQTLTVGDTASFAVLASGEGPLTYRWSREDSLSWIPDATASSLQLTSLGLFQDGGYTVVVGNDFGLARATTHLTVVDRFEITRQPPAEVYGGGRPGSKWRPPAAGCCSTNGIGVIRAIRRGRFQKERLLSLR